MMPVSRMSGARPAPPPTRFKAIALAWLVTLIIASSMPAAPGVVQTRAGRMIEGDIRLDPGAGLAITTRGGGTLLVPFDDLQTMELGAEATTKSHGASNSPAMKTAAKLQPIPKPWQQSAIGNGRFAITAGLADESFILRAGGTNIWTGGHDQGCFIHQKLTGNGSLTARLEGTDARFAGLMMRKSLAADAEFVLLASEGEDGRSGLTYVTRRSAEYRDKYKTQGDRQHRDGLPAPLWMRLDREGKKFTAYLSRDEGVHWQVFATSHGRQAEEILAGLFVCGGESETAREAIFRKVTLDRGNANSKSSREQQLVRESANTGQRTSSAFIPQVVLRNGTVLMGKILQLDPSGVRQSVFGKEQFCSSVQVARVIYRPVPLPTESLLRAGRPGVLLINGDFLEGEITAVRNNNLSISSVLLGQRQIDLGNKVSAVVWNAEQPSAECLKVRLRDGGLLQARELDTDGQTIRAKDASSIPMSVPWSSIAGIQRD